MKKMKKAATKKMMYGGMSESGEYGMKKKSTKKMQTGGVTTANPSKKKTKPGDKRLEIVPIGASPYPSIPETPRGPRRPKLDPEMKMKSGGKISSYGKKKSAKKMEMGGLLKKAKEMMPSSNASGSMSSGLKRGVRKPKLGAKMEMLTRKNGGMTKKKKSY